MAIEYDNPLMRGADLDNISIGGESVEDSFFDYITYGTISAITSAAVGFYNTGVSLGTVVGLADDEDQLDEVSTVKGLFGSDVSDFYSRHKTGIDVAGLVGGSLVPGLAAIKALRVAQRAGKLGSGMQLATGMGTTDIVLGGKAVKAATDSVLSGASFSLQSKAVYRAYAHGFKQQFLEGVVFDIGVLASMNQNAAINPDDLSYFEAVGDQAVHGLPFLFAGAALGGAVDAFRIRGSIKRAWKSEAERTNFLANPELPSAVGITPGDQISLYSRVLNEFSTSEDFAVTATDAFAIKQKTKGINTINTAINDAITNLEMDKGVGKTGIKTLQDLLKPDQNGYLDIQKIDEVVSSLTGVSKYSKADMAEMVGFFGTTRAPIYAVVSDLSNPANVQGLIDSITPQLRGTGKYSEETIELFQKNFPLRLKDAFQRDKVVGVATTGASKNLIINVEGGILHPSAKVSTANLSESFLNLNNALRENLGLPAFTADEYIDIIALHELSHGKSNSPAHIDTFMKRLNKSAVGAPGKPDVPGKTGIISRTFVNELLNLSKEIRPDVFRTANFDRGLEILQKKFKLTDMKALKMLTEANKLVRNLSPSATKALTDAGFSDFQITRMLYLADPKELLADAGAAIASPLLRERTAKIAPSVARFFDEYGGVAKAWKPNSIFYNRRTGETLTSHLPGIQDIGKVTRTDEGIVLEGVQNRHIAWNPNVFKDEITSDYLKYQAQFAYASKMDLTHTGRIVPFQVNAHNIPLLERLITKPEQLDDGAEIFINASDGSRLFSFTGLDLKASAKDLADFLIERKLELRGQMLAKATFNEQEIAHILNISTDRAMGHPTGDMLLMAERDFFEPEVLKMHYNNKIPMDYKVSAHSAQAIQERVRMAEHQRQTTAAEILESAYTKMPDPDKLSLRAINNIDETEGRAHLLGGLRPDFLSFRESADYVGRQVNQLKNTTNQAITERFVPFYETLNAVENGHLRAEFVLLDNLASRDWYHLVKLGDEAAIIRKSDALSPKFWGLRDGDALPDLADLSEGAFEHILKTAADPKSPVAKKVSPEVARLLDSHIKANADFIRKKKLIATAHGKDVNYDPTVIYTPPRDLKKTPYFAFVVPKTFLEGADSRKFMVYGNTAEELQDKIALINRKHGAKYKVFTKTEVEDYKKLTGEYEKGLVFDEIEFDATMFRTGKSAEIAPNLDLNSTQTLDRYKTFQHRQSEYIINAGVELKYSDTIQQLRRMDREASKFQKSGVFTKKHKDTIWKDTESLFFDSKSAGGELETAWQRVNDFIGEQGSKVIGDGIDILGEQIRVKGKVTQADLDAFNSHLSSLGYEPPFTKVMDAILASPNTQDSQIVPSLVRAMNNISGSLMLRLDPANSVINTISAPILLSPVLKEAKLALRNTAKYTQLENLTTTVVPGAGFKEPGVMKMVSKATKRFFTEDGKAFLRELEDRGIVTDFLREYLDVVDMRVFNGRHNVSDMLTKFDKMVAFGSKFTGHKLSEQFTRFLTADSIKQIGEVRGIPVDELYPMMASAIDKVHGVYRGSQRAQLFQGPVGQAIGLFQTYMFNWAQNMVKHLESADRSGAAIMVGMQSGLFGIQSLPGFTTFNQLIGETNKDNLDLYSVTNADDPNSLGAYFLYGLGSHALIKPVDFFSRGDMAVRNSLVVPTSFNEIPSVSIIAKAISNMVSTASAIAGDAPTGEALLHGLAHNGFNRPLKGLGEIALNYTSSGKGQKYFDDINYLDYNGAEDMNWGAMFARILGTKPLNEAIYMDGYFRKKEYQASMNTALQSISSEIQLSAHSGDVTGKYFNFANRYEQIGGDPNNFQAYWSRQLTRSTKAEVQDFKKELEGDTPMGRLYKRQKAEYSIQPIWEY